MYAPDLLLARLRKTASAAPGAISPALSYNTLPFHTAGRAMGERDGKSKFSKRGEGDDKPAPAKEAAGLSGMARRFATVEASPAAKPAVTPDVKPGKAGPKAK